MRPTAKRVGAAVVLAWFISAAAPAAGQNYTFTNIADTTGPYLSFPSAPQINNAATLSFDASLDAGGFGVFRSNGTTTTTIADSTGPYFDLTFTAGNHDINDAGQVSYVARPTATTFGLFRADGLTVTAIADTTGPLSFFSGVPRINNAGSVVFGAELDGSGDDVIQVGSGGTLTTIANTTGPFSSVFTPDINASGTVAFHAGFDAGGQGVLRGNGGTTSTAVDSSGEFGQFGFVAINDFGQLLVYTQPDVPGDRLIRVDGTTVTTVVTTAGPGNYQDISFGEQDINNLAGIAFHGIADGNVNGIFTGADPLASKVIAVGDALFGSTLVATNFEFGGLNNAGQIAFRYQLANGRQGVAIATPIPEPASALALATAGLGLLLRRRPRV